MYNYQDFTCTQDILIFLDLCKEEQEKVFKRLDSIKLKPFDPNRKKLRKERKELKETLGNINSKIKKCIDILESATTFNKDLFLQFLERYLSLKGKEVYVLMKDVVEYDSYMPIARDIYLRNIMLDSLLGGYYMGVDPLATLYSKKYNIIASVSNKERLDNLESWGENIGNIKACLSVCEDGHYLCLDDASIYTLLNGTKLRKCFSKFPYMHELAYDLIDMKLENPMMDDEERLNKILAGLDRKKRITDDLNNCN